MRHANPGAAYFLSKNVKASIINAGDGAHEHPTQGLLDYSIREKLGEVEVKVVIVGDVLHSRVALSIYTLCKCKELKSKFAVQNANTKTY
jgi:aspartate carbamoyltransferase catalytic subunit